MGAVHTSKYVTTVINRDMATAVPAPSADGMLAGRGVERLRGVFNTEARVAVVGSSGNLLFRGHGAEIDAHDIVIRMKYCAAGD